MLIYLKQLILKEKFLLLLVFCLFGFFLFAFFSLVPSLIERKKLIFLPLAFSSLLWQDSIFAQSLPAWILGAAQSALGLGYMIRRVSLCFDDVLKTVYSLDPLSTTLPKAVSDVTHAIPCPGPGSTCWLGTLPVS